MIDERLSFEEYIYNIAAKVNSALSRIMFTKVGEPRQSPIWFFFEIQLDWCRSIHAKQLFQFTKSVPCERPMNSARCPMILCGSLQGCHLLISWSMNETFEHPTWILKGQRDLRADTVAEPIESEVKVDSLSLHQLLRTRYKGDMLRLTSTWIDFSQGTDALERIFLDFC